MNKEKHILIVPLVSILVLVGGLFFPVLFFQSFYRGDAAQGHMCLPFLLACVLSLSVISKSIQQTRTKTNWNLTSRLVSLTGFTIIILLLGLIAANVLDLIQGLGL